MILGVVSDTHGQVEFAREAVRALEPFSPDLLIHCGDIGSPAIPAVFDQWETHYVFGNVDYDTLRLEAAIRAAGGTCHGQFGELDLAGRRVAFLHSHDGQRFRAACLANEWDLICYGHTHVAERHRQGKTLVLNPGALYRASPHTSAVVELPDLEVHEIKL